MISNLLKSADKKWLSTWFVNNYIQKCFKLCPDYISRLFNDVSSNAKLQNVVSAVVNWRLNTALNDTWDVFQTAELFIPYYLSTYSLTVRSCVCWITELEKTHNLPSYFTAVAFLHVASEILRGGFSAKWLDVLETIAGQCVSIHHHPSQCSSELSLSKATKLMKVVANSSHSTMQLIESELSKAYLYRALRCKDSDSDSIYCLTNVYLAVLYYTTGQYQTAIDHCTLVMRSQDHSQCSSHVVH